MYADYQELVAAKARESQELRAMRAETEELKAWCAKPCAKPAAPAADVHKGNAGDLVYKTRDDARVVDGDTSGAPVARTTAKQPWWEWVDKRLRSRDKLLTEAFGEAMGEFVGGKLDPIRRELALTRRELDVVRMEVNVKALKEEVAAARAAIPKFDAEQRQLREEQRRLERELAATKDKLGKLRVDQSITDFNVREMRRQAGAAGEASIELEFESTSSRFQMKAAQPEAAQALKRFALEIIGGQTGGTIWLPSSAGTA